MSTNADQPRFATGHLADLYARVLTESGVSDAEMVGGGRPPGAVAAREAFVVLARGLGCSFPEIARAMGRRSHSTATMAWRRHLVRPDPLTARLVGRCGLTPPILPVI